MVKGGGGTTTTTTELPPELRELASGSSANVLQAQRQAPLSEFLGPAPGAFQTAGRAPQFGQAQRQIGESQRISRETPASRSGLNRQPTGTGVASDVARLSESRASQVPGAFANLRPVAQRQASAQGFEDAALRTATRAQGQASQVPTTFGGTQRDFNQGIDPLQNLAGTVPGTFGDVRSQADPRIADLVSLSDRQVTGQGIQDSPSFQAANQAFESAILPQLQNSAALSGLGRTTGLQQSIGAAQAQFLLPIIQGELAREERGLDRGLGARQFGINTASNLGLQEAQAQERGIGRATDIGQFGLATGADLGLQRALGEERGIQRGQQASQFRAGIEQAAGQQDLQRALEGLGADERSRALRFQQSQGAIPQLAQLGQLEQAFGQGALDRSTQDFLRQQALSEQALFQPFGLVAPSTIGQTATNSSKKGK